MTYEKQRAKREAALRDAVEAAYQRARLLVYDLGLREGDSALTPLQQQVLKAFHTAEHDLETFRGHGPKEPPPQ